MTSEEVPGGSRQPRLQWTQVDGALFPAVTAAAAVQGIHGEVGVRGERSQHGLGGTRAGQGGHHAVLEEDPGLLSHVLRDAFPDAQEVILHSPGRGSHQIPEVLLIEVSEAPLHFGLHALPEH